MPFHLQFRVELIGVAVQSLLYLLFVLMVKVGSHGIDFFVILDTVKENDTSSTIHHCTYPIFYLSLVIFQLRHTSEDLKWGLINLFIINILLLYKESTASKTSIFHKSFFLDLIY